jgi:ethanolaminephosphotransferase
MWAVTLCTLACPDSHLLRGICSSNPVHPMVAKVLIGSLIASGAAMPFTAHATSPTITMPRIKAITTGSIPSFLDVILNFAESDTTSSLSSQDTWLAQMKAKGSRTMVMYGDDTWLKLFPETFDRADGTSSFFVSVSRA